MRDKVRILSLERDVDCEITTKLKIEFVYNCKENSINGIVEEIEELIKKYSL